MLFRSFPFYRQLDAADCGPACLRMVAAHYGKHIPLAVLRDSSYLDREGVHLRGLIEASANLGFRPLAVRLPFETSAEGANSFRDVPLPCIVHWRQRHFVVVYKMDDRSVWIADPARGKIRLSREEFLDGWLSRDEGMGTALLLEPTDDFFQKEHRQRGRSVWHYLWEHFLPFRKLAWQLGAGIFLAGILQLLFPFLTQAVVDIGIRNQDLGFIWLILIGQLMLFGSQLAVQYIQSWILLHLTARVNVSLLSDYLGKLLRLPLAFFDRKMMGDLLQRIQDHQRIEQFLAVSSLNVAFSAFSLLIFGLVLLWYSPLLFLVFFLGSLLYFGWVFLFLKKRAVVDQQRFEQLADNQNTLIELVEGIQEIKLQTSARRHQDKWAGIQRRLFQANVRSLQLGQYQDIGGALISQSRDILITILAATAVVQGQLTLGMLLAVQYIVGQLNAPVLQLIRFIRQTQDAAISLERLSEVLEEPKDRAPEERASIPKEMLQAGISFQQVSFRYHPLQEQVLEKISLLIPYGKVTAFVGGSGSGKTTLIKLLLGFYLPESGEIRIGNRPLPELSPDYWRSQCGVVLQDSYLFSDTIARNIAEGADSIDPERLREVAEAAQILGFIEQLPLGFETMIGHKGNKLSQGQQQRLLLARALYKDPAYLILDEATNALDAHNERRFWEALNRAFTGKTRILVAHRLNTVRRADQIVVLQDGQVVEWGTHEELIERKGAYFELVRDQLSWGK